MRSESPTFALTWSGFHVIDERSPLRRATPKLSRAQNLMIIAIGLDETLVQTIRARHAYEVDDMGRKIFRRRDDDATRWTGSDRLDQVPRPGIPLALCPPYSALPLPAGLFICQRASATRSICAFI